MTELQMRTSPQPTPSFWPCEIMSRELYQGGQCSCDRAVASRMWCWLKKREAWLEAEDLASTPRAATDFLGDPEQVLFPL